MNDVITKWYRHGIHHSLSYQSYVSIICGRIDFCVSFFAYQFVPERVLNGNTITDIDNSNFFTFIGRRYANNSDGSRMCIFYLWVD